MMQRVLKEECSRWKLVNNVLVYKTSADAALIHVVWLHEKKMTSIDHLLDASGNELDFFYIDGYLVVAAENNFKFVHLPVSEIKMPLSPFAGPEMETAQSVKEPVGFIHQDKVCAVHHNSLKNEVVFVCQSDQNRQTVFFKFQINEPGSKRPVQLAPYTAPADAKKGKLDRRSQKLVAEPQPIISTQIMI